MTFTRAGKHFLKSSCGRYTVSMAESNGKKYTGWHQTLNNVSTMLGTKKTAGSAQRLCHRHAVGRGCLDDLVEYQEAKK